jgi:hypothetical protein
MKALALAMEAAVALPKRVIAQVHQRRITRRGSDINIAALSTVPAVGTAEGNVRFFSKTTAPVAALATDNFNSDAIYKHG